jgi:hypothetical protein
MRHCIAVCEYHTYYGEQCCVYGSSLPMVPEEHHLPSGARASRQFVVLKKWSEGGLQ